MRPFAEPAALFSSILRAACDPTVLPPQRAMSRNLLAEHRVSQDRFNSFCKIVGVLKSIADIEGALVEYQKYVRPSRAGKDAPAYRLPENEGNAVVLPPGTEIATFLDLTRLGRIFAEAKSEFKLAEFADYEATDPRAYAQINKFLGDNFSKPSRRIPLLEAILRARTRYRLTTEKRIHPTWVSEWQSLEPYLKGSSPIGWFQAVGVPIEEPRWVAAFRYRVSTPERTIPLFRPTQLDVGWYAHHFPSPPVAALDQGGHAMYLIPGASPLAAVTPRPLVREYLHEEIDFTMDDWEFAGNLLGLAVPGPGDLDIQRKGHWDRLQAVYSSKPIIDWMPECP